MPTHTLTAAEEERERYQVHALKLELQLAEARRAAQHSNRTVVSLRQELLVCSAEREEAVGEQRLLKSELLEQQVVLDVLTARLNSYNLPQADAPFANLRPVQL